MAGVTVAFPTPEELYIQVNDLQARIHEATAFCGAALQHAYG